jgi:hypothetical protein
MKISNIVIALVTLFAVACTDEKTANEHGHAHGTEEHGHDHDDDHHEQEEFTVNEDSVEVMTDSTTHAHDDSSLHHNH